MAYYDDELWDELLPASWPIRKQRPIETVLLPDEIPEPMTGERIASLFGVPLELLYDDSDIDS